MIALIAAMTPDRVIGREGRIPWNIPGEQKRFKELTMGHTIVMGRRTYEEIGRPLPGRQTIVVSTTKNFDQPGVPDCRFPDRGTGVICRRRCVYIRWQPSVRRGTAPGRCAVSHGDREPDRGGRIFPGI